MNGLAWGQLVFDGAAILGMIALARVVLVLRDAIEELDNEYDANRRRLRDMTSRIGGLTRRVDGFERERDMERVRAAAAAAAAPLEEKPAALETTDTPPWDGS
ncbi:hypothetical protein [Actinomadura sp. NPDC048394]|uniref:hypothetical protein n=1 Tax=Actinomadura sp. NPDC048394 TaxID=3158223 RepID=UPI0033F230A9